MMEEIAWNAHLVVLRCGDEMESAIPLVMLLNAILMITIVWNVRPDASRLGLEILSVMNRAKLRLVNTI